MDIVLFLETNCSPLQIFEGHLNFHILVIGDSRGYNITSGYNITTKTPFSRSLYLDLIYFYCHTIYYSLNSYQILSFNKTNNIV